MGLKLYGVIRLLQVQTVSAVLIDWAMPVGPFLTQHFGFFIWRSFGSNLRITPHPQHVYISLQR